MITRLIIMLATLSLTACGSLSPPDSYYNAQAARATAAGQTASQPLLRITGGFQCAETDGEQGACKIEVFDPRAHESIANIDRGTTGADVAIEGIRALSGVAKFGIGGYVVTRALREVGEKTYNVSNQGDGGLTFNNDTHSTDLTSSSIDGTVTETSTVSGDTFGDQANTSGQIGDDSTHPPTVVDQPAPVVVTAPDPVIVTQPAPIVVQP